MVQLSYTKKSGKMVAMVSVVFIGMGAMPFDTIAYGAASAPNSKIVAATVSSSAAVTAPTQSVASAQKTTDTNAGGIPQPVSTTCMACHGMTGISPGGSMFPDLAGQWAPYLVKQLNNFRSHTRADPMACHTCGHMKVRYSTFIYLLSFCRQFSVCYFCFRWSLGREVICYLLHLCRR